MARSFSPTHQLYDEIQSPAFPGMKGDSMFDNVESWACGQETMMFGVVCGFMPDRIDGTIYSGENVYYVGISGHDHLRGAYDTYRKGDSVNAINKGKIWAKVHDTATDDGIILHGPVFFHPVTGEITNSTSQPSLPNCNIRSKIKVTPPLFGRIGGARVVLVEMDATFFTNIVQLLTP